MADVAGDDPEGFPTRLATAGHYRNHLIRLEFLPHLAVDRERHGAFGEMSD